MSKKILAVFLAVAMVFTFASCTSKNEDEKETTTYVTNQSETGKSDKSLRISYTKSDSLNPYKAETENNIVIADLVFDSLVKLDESFSPVLQIASSYEFTAKDKLVVNFPVGIKFSDGSELTSTDIVSSFNLAKNSVHYANTLLGIKSANAQSQGTVVFQLEYQNPKAVNLLTFPIVQNASADTDLPIGSGKYAFYKKSNNEIQLIQNENKPDFSPYIKVVDLVNIASAESIANGISIDNIDYAYFSLDSSESKKIKSQIKAVNINNLVFIGFNTSTGNIMSLPDIRNAVSLAINRDAISKSAYHGFAYPASSIFNPTCDLATVSNIFSKENDETGAKQAIIKSGYDISKATVRLLVNSGNVEKSAMATIVKSALESVGFKVKIYNVPYADYIEALSKGYYDIYIGETKLADDMNLFPFFAKDGAVNYGVDINSTCAQAYSNYLNGGEIGTFVMEFTKTVPFVPVVYRKGVIGYSKSIHADMQGIYKNYFSNIEEWYFEK